MEVEVEVKKDMGSNNAYGRLSKGRVLMVDEDFFKVNKEYLKKKITKETTKDKGKNGGTE